MLKVMWYNINGIKGKANDVVDFLESEQIDVLLLQEATNIDEYWLKTISKKLMRIQCILVCEVPNKHLAAIIRTTTVPSYGVMHSGDRLQVLKITTVNESFVVANHYGPHKKDREHYKLFGETVSKFANEGKFLLGGDHNAVTVASDRSQKRLDENSALLLQALMENNLQDVNELKGVERFHTFYRSGSSSRIDHVWCNRAGGEAINTIEMFTRNGVHSDHFLTMITLRTDTQRSLNHNRTVYRFPKNKEDPKWLRYGAELISVLENNLLNTIEDVDEQCRIITSSIFNQAKVFEHAGEVKIWRNSRAVKRLLKRREVLVKFLANREWTGEVESMCGWDTIDSRESRVWYSLKKVSESLHKVRAHKANQKFRKWEWKARTSEFSDPSSFFSASTAKKSSRVRLSRVKVGGIEHMDDATVGEVAAEYFEGAFAPAVADMTYLDGLRSSGNRDLIQQAFTPITTEEVSKAVGWLRNRKCPGPDGIHNEMLKVPCTKKRDYRWELSDILAGFFNNITKQGKFPAMWKEATIISAYKKGDATNPANYRPICLLSTVSKLYTKLINRRISVAAETGGIFSNVQGGGRKFRDIREKLSIVRGIIDHANRENKQLFLLLTDISKAFDSVPHNAIKAIYEFFEFPDNVVRLVSGMVENNFAGVLTRAVSRRFPIGKGTRQGDSLSPTTYILVHQTVLMYVDRKVLGYRAMSQGLWNAAYIDDCNLFAESRADIERAAQAMSEVLSLRMSMHPDKLELYVRQMEKDTGYDIEVDGTVVPARDSSRVFRALGLFTNLKGNTKQQIEQAWNKSQRVVTRLKMMKLTPRQVARVVNTCIHPIFKYASEFTDWTDGWILKVNRLGRMLVKHGSVAMKRFPSELLPVSSDRGSIGLNDIEETITTQTAWFVSTMVSGKRDTEAKQLLLDTLEEIKQKQTFQSENVFQSSNRLEHAKHSYMKWCALRMHRYNIKLGKERVYNNCDDCNIARYVPSVILKRLYLGGITNRDQLVLDNKLKSLKDIRIDFPGCKIGTRSHEMLKIVVSQMNGCECQSQREDPSSSNAESLMMGDSRIESREQLQSMMDQQRTERISGMGLYWLQADAIRSGADFSFLKYPHKINRQVEWFFTQKRQSAVYMARMK